ncbi:LppX_LprAFG lipoprotein [Mycolicibacterium sp. ND9-15]|uniref:LppX_LprAFG lipoprotein n=1 Tax=Mycolicibacterium sp. ND9-15 TaxID=3042320 RepID=UPI002DD7FFE3|nr:LppX_LprAFG lipoprotein [Mycolicibacterium sp. ND9-15]WSE56604.1 LppX_LprAFG lipoprotein [Mycolicibacterium sp. ND9-15]
MPKRLVMILVALATAVAFLAGCSKAEEPAKDLPDPATLLQQSSQTTKRQTSAHMKLTVEGPTEKLPIELLEGDLSNAPEFTAQGKVNLLMMGQRLEGVEFVIVDGNLYATLTPGGALSNFGPAVDTYDASLILNPETGLANVLANFSDPKADGRETVNDVETVRVTGNVSADAVNKIAPQIGATGPVPGTAWIAEDGDHELVQVKLQTDADTSLTMVLSEWGKPVTVTKPPAA